MSSRQSHKSNPAMFDKWRYSMFYSVTITGNKLYWKIAYKLVNKIYQRKWTEKKILKYINHQNEISSKIFYIHGEME